MNRRMRAGTCAVAVALLAAGGLGGCDSDPTGPGAAPVGAEGGSWRTWVVTSPSSLRPPPPPASGSEEHRRELDEVVRLQRERGSAVPTDRVSAIQPTVAWTLEATDLLEFYWHLLPDVRTASPARSARIMALLHVAMYDALVATWDAKYAYDRRPPYQVDSRIRSVGVRTGVPSYPSEHAAAAAAAVEVLSYAFPQEDRGRLEEKAREVGLLRIAGGHAFPSDIEAGDAIGRTAAQRVLEWAAADGSAAVFAGSAPEEPWAWRPTPPRRTRVPFDATAGEWRTWVIPTGDAFRLPPPPMPGSEAFERDLDELRAMPDVRTLDQANAARFWATDAPSARWERFAVDEVRRLRFSALHAARAQALISVAMYDAFVACWDTKYAYWLLRPISADPEIATLFSTPPFPSYPSGHSTISGAAGEVFAYLFPDVADQYRALAVEASFSRVWGGVHYRFDSVDGKEMGIEIGRAVVAHARGDGAHR